MLVTHLRQPEVGLVGIHQRLLGLQLLRVERLALRGVRDLLGRRSDALLVAATACLVPTSATSRSATRLPPLKMGRLIWGMKVQVPVPPSNRPLSSVCWRCPPSRVSEMGKKAARAAPMLALAAFRLCSAARMSGRRCNRLEGAPTGSAQHFTSARVVAVPPARDAGCPAAGQTVSVPFHQTLVLRQADLGVFQAVRPWASSISGGGAQAVFVLGQGIALLLGGEGRLAQPATLIGQQGEVGIGHRGHQRNLVLRWVSICAR